MSSVRELEFPNVDPLRLELMYNRRDIWEKFPKRSFVMLEEKMPERIFERPDCDSVVE
jgi:hypothetical protein